MVDSTQDSTQVIGGVFFKDYKPPFTITNEILTYVSSISEKVGRISATGNMAAKPHLRNNNRIKSIHACLRIEANSFSLGQVRDVINGKTVHVEQKEIPAKFRNYLHPAIEMNLIRMTIPDKPNSRNQRYVKL